VATELERLTAALAGRYRVERELGRGGMATVYLAHDLKHDRSVALKVLKPELAAALGPERFGREVRLTARLEHPHILPLLDSGDADGLLYYVMPYVEGESLRDRLNREKQLPIPEAVRIAREVADALSHAHGLGIVHRDIKPANILLAGGHARVADFGIARAVTAAGAEKLTETGLALGTLVYMSPEQAAGDEALDARSDIYSVGCVLYEMLAGEPPYTGATAAALLARKSLEAVPSLHVVREAVPEGVERAVTKALAKVPADRFETAGHFAEALERGAVRRTDTPGAARGRRRGWTAAAAGVAGAAALALGWWAVTGPGAPTPQITSLVVLPFDNLSGDPEQEYFVDGMQEAVIGELARIRALDKVISRTSTMRYRGTDKSIPEIARELKVDAVLEGSVLRAGDRVRITLQLIEGREDRHLWADSYERDLGDVLALQGEVARAVAGEIRVAVSPAERERIELAAEPGSARRPDPEAYDAYLKGRYYSAMADEGALETAIRYYEEAIAKDPTFAGAYAALAEALFRPAVFDGPRASVAARTALDLDPALPEAYAALGMARRLEWDWSGSEAAFQRAIELNPNSSVAHQWYAQLLRTTMRFDEALSEARLAAELDPLSLFVRTMVGFVLSDQGRNDEAIEVFDEVLELEPEFGLAIFNQGLVYAEQGRGEDVISAARRAKAARLSSWEPGTTWLLGVGYALSGQRDRAEEILRELEARSATTYPGYIAVLHHMLGDEDKALAWLEKGYELRAPWLPYSTSEPWFDDLRDHPRFRALRAKMGLP
jgi:eukaryotic-like serine/threonine-protein kinase